MQLYIGGYGDEILKGVTQVAMYTQGTQYALPSEKMAILDKFMRETYYQTIRGKYMLFDVLGRGMSRPGITDKSAMSLFARRMIVLAPEYADEYRAIVERLEGQRPADYGITPLHTHYFREIILCMYARVIRLMSVWFPPVRPDVSMVMVRI